MGTEIWKTAIYDDVVYEGLYEVSNLGRVKSLNYHHTGKPGLMQPKVDKDGYLEVCLCKDGKRKYCRVHRLVTEAFLPNPNNLPQVNHKDEDKANNNIENLEWCTCKYNINYGSHNERRAKTRSKPVLQFSKTGEFIKEWSSVSECGRNGFYSGCVCRCCNGELKSHKGFIFKYKE